MIDIGNYVVPGVTPVVGSPTANSMTVCLEKAQGFFASGEDAEKPKSR